MNITAFDLVRNVVVSPSPVYLQSIQRSADLLKQAEINSPLRLAHFFAQALTETGGFTILREDMNYSASRLLEVFGVNHHSAAITPDEAAVLAHNEQAIAERVYGLRNPFKARELGNTEPGDGFRYRGNGVLQMTGRGAHRRIGVACNVDFENRPELATIAEHAMKPAVQEWTASGLNAFADKDDIRAITLRINGGYNGFTDRQAWLVKLKKVLIASGDLPAGSDLGDPSDEIRSLAHNLNLLGANPKLNEDGRLGPQAVSAIKAFQVAAGIRVDGAAGPVTLAAIQARLNALR